FRPEWLHQTRFGEILYKADVLLKELASGISVLESGKLRAEKVETYVSQLYRSNADTLFTGLHGETLHPQWSGSRLWFDIAPRQLGAKATSKDVMIQSAADRELFDTLKARRLVATVSSPPHALQQVIKEGDTLDLSKVFPTMFVRRRDLARGVD